MFKNRTEDKNATRARVLRCVVVYVLDMTPTTWQKDTLRVKKEGSKKKGLIQHYFKSLKLRHRLRMAKSICPSTCRYAVIES